MDPGSGFNKDITRALRLMMISIVSSVILMVVLILWISGLLNVTLPQRVDISLPQKQIFLSNEFWRPPDIMFVTDAQKAEEINYGKELISHTAKFLGPEGSVRQISNGMNCQNCHLDAGTKIFGNNYGAVSLTYPKFRARSGSIESIKKRVNDCFERSLNGIPLDTSSREMTAIVAYIKWLGSTAEPGEVPNGTGLLTLELLDRAADPAKGQQVYESQCVACHGKNGEGRKQRDGTEYTYPPLWGDHSYNTGAGLYRISTFAQFIHANMPLGASFENLILSEKEAWDIAAYVNSRQRPDKDISEDWPKIESKPFDHPFGPYADPFSETQHKYGPFKSIKDFYSKKISR